MTAITFSDEHRSELGGALELLPAQIAGLESIALPLIKAFLRKPPARNDVRDLLQDTADSLRSAKAAIEKLLASGSIPNRTAGSAGDAAMARVMLASYELGGAGDVLDLTLPAIGSAILVVEKASSALPKKPVRHPAASHYPIGFIDEALLSGFLKAHNHWHGTMGSGSATPLPPYLVTASCAEGSNYRRIVEICYEAAGHGAGSRERAIKSFIRSKKRTEPPRNT